MRLVLLRVGIDTGSGGIHGPLFRDGSFELMPIPDDHNVDSRTYGNSTGTKGLKLVEYFRSAARQTRKKAQAMHADPEFTTFTYGDPTRPKASLRDLGNGDWLLFYCGLEGWDHPSKPALYLVGYFEVLVAGRASELDQVEVRRHFAENFHVRHHALYEQQKPNLVLVKGSENSRLLSKAVLISETGQDVGGRPLKVLSAEMQKIFGTFGGINSIQRSPPRWVDSAYVEKAAKFVRKLP